MRNDANTIFIFHKANSLECIYQSLYVPSNCSTHPITGSHEGLLNSFLLMSKRPFIWRLRVESPPSYSICNQSQSDLSFWKLRLVSAVFHTLSVVRFLIMECYRKQIRSSQLGLKKRRCRVHPLVTRLYLMNYDSKKFDFLTDSASIGTKCKSEPKLSNLTVPNGRGTDHLPFLGKFPYYLNNKEPLSFAGPIRLLPVLFIEY